MEPFKDGQDNIEILPEQMTDEDEHGTCIASVAAGRRFGAAPKADLHLVKITGNFIDKSENVPPGQSPRILSGDFTHEGIMEAFEHILKLIKDPASPKRGKAVVNMSWCRYFSRSADVDDNTFLAAPGGGVFDHSVKDYLQDLWKQDVVTITAAGNRAYQIGTGFELLDLTTPHLLGGKGNPLITVGGYVICGFDIYIY